MTPISLAVLDLAGTGVDGFAERVDYLRATMGRSKIEVFRALLGGDAGAARANDAFEAAYGTRVAAGEVRAIDGAESALAALRDGGVRVCLTTGFSPSTLDGLLAALGWRSRVDLALAPGPGTRGRPHPDLILRAVLALGIDDVRAVAVAGDTASDLESGTRAGASVVAGVLTGAHGRDRLMAAPHTHLLDSVAEFPALCLG